MFIRIDEAELQRACNDLKVDPPRIVLSTKSKGYTLGEYSTLGVITVFCGTERPGGNLRQMLNTFNNTILHELRHHHQWTHNPKDFDDKPGAYLTTKYEADARQWAAENIKEYRIVRIAPRTAPRSTLSRLSETERIVKKT